jgi:hypothetical protein
MTASPSRSAAGDTQRRMIYERRAEPWPGGLLMAGKPEGESLRVRMFNAQEKAVRMRLLDEATKRDQTEDADKDIVTFTRHEIRAIWSSIGKDVRQLTDLANTVARLTHGKGDRAPRWSR